MPRRAAALVAVAILAALRFGAPQGADARRWERSLALAGARLPARLAAARRSSERKSEIRATDAHETGGSARQPDRGTLRAREARRGRGNERAGGDQRDARREARQTLARRALVLAGHLESASGWLGRPRRRSPHAGHHPPQDAPVAARAARDPPGGATATELATTGVR